MGVNEKSRRGAAVVVLSRDAGVARAAQSQDTASQYGCLRVTSPYETAAELLAEHPLALVIDMRCLTPGDLPLLEMARQRDIEILAVGSLPFGVSASDLSGVCLTTREHLAPRLRDLVAGLGRPALLPGDVPRARPVGEVRPPQPDRPVGESPRLSALAQWVIKASRVGQDAAKQTAKAPAGQNKDEDKNGDGKLPDRPGELLTREELTALLEDR